MDKSSRADVSRRSFIRHTGTAAMIAAAAGATIAGSAKAATPTQTAGSFMQFGDEFLKSYGGIVAEIDGWCGSTGNPIIQLIRLHALHDYLDDWCPTYPKRPPWPIPPRFERYAAQLGGLDKIVDIIDGWCGTTGTKWLPAPVSIGIFSSDIDDWCGTRPRPWPRPPRMIEEFGF
jgi:hypothetical protein